MKYRYLFLLATLVVALQIGIAVHGLKPGHQTIQHRPQQVSYAKE